MRRKETIAERLRRLRMEKVERYCLGLNEAARRAGISPQRLWKYEHGKSVPPPEIVERLADVLGVTTRMIMDGHD